MRITDAVLSLPALLLAIALVAVLGPSLGIVIGGHRARVRWTGIARIVYSRVIVIRETEFVLAARALGVGPRRLLVRHVMPHLISLVLVYATLGIASTVPFEATLSFLGVGIPPPGASWGLRSTRGWATTSQTRASSSCRASRSWSRPGVQPPGATRSRGDAFDPHHRR